MRPGISTDLNALVVWVSGDTWNGLPSVTVQSPLAPGNLDSVKMGFKVSPQNGAPPPEPPPPPPMWMNAQAFMSSFTMEEKAAVALSSDPIIAALRLELSTWLSQVHVDDERVQLGLNRLVELEILTNDRKNAIISVAS